MHVAPTCAGFRDWTLTDSVTPTPFEVEVRILYHHKIQSRDNMI